MAGVGATEGVGRLAPPWLRGVIRRLTAATTEPFAVRVGDGPALRFGTEAPRFTIVVRSPGRFARVALRPSMLTVGEAFIDGAFDVEGDLFLAIATAYRLAAAGEPAPPGVLERLASRLRRRPDPAAVAAHYDLSNDFYALFLDPRMIYTCAVYPRPEATLEEAQETKLDLVCRKLGLAAGERLLDVGCGWGGLVAWASERHGATATGVTLSAAQAAWAGARLGDRACVERRDVHELPADGRFDKISALGVIEHVGVANYRRYFAQLRGLLRRGGLVLNHGITHRTTSPRTTGMAFLDRYVFPGGDLASVEHTTAEMIAAGLEILHVEAIGRHYAPTLRAWLVRLTARRDAAVALVGERAYRVYVGYFAAAAVAFEAGWIDVHQVVARRP